MDQQTRRYLHASGKMKMVEEVHYDALGIPVGVWELLAMQHYLPAFYEMGRHQPLS